MSTENNLESLYQNSIKILSDLISFKTISGENNGDLIDYCDKILKSIGAQSFRTYDKEKKSYSYNLPKKTIKPTTKSKSNIDRHFSRSKGNKKSLRFFEEKTIESTFNK